MMRLNSILGRTLVSVPLIIFLSLWASIPFYLERYGGLTGKTLGAITSWEVLVLTLPIAGFVASVYGWFFKNLVSALLVGVIPYFPLIFLGIPVIVFLGFPMGMIGAGSTLFRRKKIGPGHFLIAAGIVWWGISAFLILRGFR